MARFVNLCLAALAIVGPFVRGLALDACHELSEHISGASDVIYALHDNFTDDIHHWYYSSTQIPTCVLEVGSDQDVSIAMQIIGSSRTPFAVISGGHASNPGFSSTEGVHISMARMTQVILSPDKSTVEIGFGMTWADVYTQLDGSGVNVVGGRTVGPGVGGFTLGGGFSWKTSQHGLTSDSVKSFNLVLPNGTITTVDASTPDLFFALKGGLNRFGIVTSAVFNTHEQPSQVYGGITIYTPSKGEAVLDATAEFLRINTDPRAEVITTLQGSPAGSLILTFSFYDGPEKPPSFAPFDPIDHLVSTVDTSSFADFVQGFPSQVAINIRGTFHTMSTSSLTPTFLAAVKNESDSLGDIMLDHSGYSISFDIEPFLSTYGQQATESAYPHSDSPLPLNLYFAWVESADDAYWYAAMKQSIANLQAVAMQEGIYKADFTAYPNYAISGTTAEELYGAQNAARLRAIRAVVDPDDVMGLTGGFTI